MGKRQNSLALTVSWLAFFLLVFIWSAIEPKDRLTWVLEVSPAALGLLAVGCLLIAASA